MSKNPGQFKDIGKDANDLLNKGYDDYDTKFEINAVGLNASVKASFTKNQEKTSGSLEYKTKCEKCGDLTTTLDFGKSVKVSAVSKDKFIQKLDTTLEFSSNPAKLFDEAKVKVTADYAQLDAATLNANLTVPVGGAAPTSVISAVIGSREHGFAVGGEVELNATRGQFTRLEGALGYKKGSSSLTLFSKTNRDNSNNTLSHKFGSSFYYRFATSATCSCNPIVAAEAVYNPKDSVVALVAGVLTKPDATSTLKAKVSSLGQLNVAFNKDLEKPLSIGLFSQTNLLNLSEVKLGVKLAYTQ
jgi:hypothetical protein